MNRAILSSVVALASAASFGLSLWFSYKSGCAGDLKTGSYGDMQLALRYDADFGKSLIFGMVLGMSAPLVGGNGSPRIVGYAALCMVPVAIIVWLAGMQFSIWGVQACFPR
jgi:hypothetical protein